MATESLTPYEQWMVESNLETLRSTGRSAVDQAALLRAGGYDRIAEAIETQAPQSSAERRPKYVRELETRALRAEARAEGYEAGILWLRCYVTGPKFQRDFPYVAVEDVLARCDDATREAGDREAAVPAR